ncbi:hypothetical protein MUU74_12940 [Chryseobacterium daecheongense]|uniref:hypothetical protein n=1 Tax=Chryseobacterium daecheongense TaxID=192389 RepID=UPI001FD6D9A2|nr:hypothetical protein [Chryseobacterium daecheongense]UOU97395.1 hypothetical protein MUU74_12940 [Chryseobacterium daecheongense]
MNKEILKQLKSDYEKLEIKPSADLWDRIDSMDQKTEKGSGWSPKAHFQWWKYAAIVLLLISVGTIIYYNINKVEQHNILSRIQTNQINDKDLEGIQEKHNNENVLPDSELAADTKPRNYNTSQNKTADHSIRPDKKIEYTQNITKKQNGDLDNTPVQVAFDDRQIKHPDVIVKPEESIAPDNKLAVSTEKSEIKNTKYIKASDLLTGREYDKVRGNQETTSYGRINLSRLKPHFSQVVSLGVTVHSETK